MNVEEVTTTCRVVAALCPAQKFEQDTPQAWAMVLADVRFEDAKDAVMAIASRKPFVDVAEIRAEVARIRGTRIAQAGPLIPPPGLSDVEEHRWLGEARRRVGDGVPPAQVCPVRDLVAGDVAGVLAAADPGQHRDHRADHARAAESRRAAKAAVAQSRQRARAVAATAPAPTRGGGR